MKRYAEVINGEVRHIFKCSDDFTPKFSPPIEAIEVKDDKVKEGWGYDGEKFVEQPERKVADDFSVPLTDTERDTILVALAKKFGIHKQG